jgi:hypothetical protein
MPGAQLNDGEYPMRAITLSACLLAAGLFAATFASSRNAWRQNTVMSTSANPTIHISGIRGHLVPVRGNNPSRLIGGRILMGVLPGALARPLSRFEPYGLLIIIGLLFVLPPPAAQLGI